MVYFVANGKVIWEIKQQIRLFFQKTFDRLPLKLIIVTQQQAIVL